MILLKIFLPIFLLLLNLTLFPSKANAQEETQKYKLGRVLGNLPSCIPDKNGPFTYTQCQDEIANLKNPGKYKIDRVLGNVPNCVKDENGTFTYSQCQDEIANLRNPGKYKIAKLLNVDQCVQDPNGNFNTISECQDALETQKSPKGPKGTNPCSTGPGGECPTALGNIPTTATAFAQKVLSIGLGVGGGIALIFMVYGSIRVLVSTGDPKKIAEGREIITAAIVGLLFIIFSVLILRFIGISLLPSNPFS